MRPNFCVFLPLFVSIATVAEARDHFVAPLDVKIQKTSNLLSNGSRDHPWPSIKKAIASGSVVGGDRLLLLSGKHGGFKLYKKHFNPPISIMSASSTRAQLDWITIRASSGLRIERLNIWPRTLPSKIRTLIILGKTTDNIILSNLDIRSGKDAENYLQWSKSDWVGSHRLSGVQMGGTRNILHNSQITGTRHAITATGNGARVVSNVILGFSGDAMRGLGDNSVFIGNRAENCFKVDKNHDDGFQSWATRIVGGIKRLRGLVFEQNQIFEWTGPKEHPLRCQLQGVGMYDGMYENISIRNNLVIVTAYHGISVYGAVNTKIINNTVIHANGKSGKFPWIGIFDHKNGTLGIDNLIINNLSSNYINHIGPRLSNGRVFFPKRAFQDIDSGDYTPTKNSRFRDVAVKKNAPLIDVYGNSRRTDSGPDLGAIEAK